MGYYRVSDKSGYRPVAKALRRMSGEHGPQATP
jgi:hypothetical protein